MGSSGSSFEGGVLNDQGKFCSPTGASAALFASFGDLTLELAESFRLEGKTMRRLLAKSLSVLIVVGAMAAGGEGSIAADPPQKPSGSTPATAALGRRVQEITDAVLQNHIDPPARQQMILAGIKGLYQASGLPVPSGLSRRISTLTTPEQFASLLAELWPAKPAKPISTQALEEALVDGLLDSVPGNATLMAAKELKVQEQIQGNRYVGIHIQVRYDDKEKRTVIQALVPGGPADRAGAKKDDRIEQVNGVDTTGLSLAQVVDRIRGPEGTEVVLVVRQPKAKEARTLKMVRGTLFVPTVLGVRKRSSGDWDFDLGGPDKIAYLQIQDITASTPHELRKLAGELQSQGFRQLVLDLRNVLQASFHPTVLLADSLLDHGRIGRMRQADRVMTYEATPGALFRGWPIAVLVNWNTTCGAEWLAAALQDNHRAMIVGTPTASAFAGRGPFPRAGTGDVSSTIPLGDGSWSLSLTTGELQRSDGRSIAAPAGKEPGLGIIERRLAPDSPEVTRFGVKPDHLAGKGPDIKDQSFPRMRSALEARGQDIDPTKDEFITKAVSLLREASKKS
jgi:carboxyl-terminal processing protease